MSESQDTPELYDNPSDTGEYEYEDPEEFHRIQRLKQIHGARERFDKGRHKVYHAADRGQITLERARSYTAQLAVDFIRQLEPLVRRTDSDLLEREIQIQIPQGTTTVTGTVADLLDGNGDLVITENTQRVDPETNAPTQQTRTKRVTLDRRAATRLVRLGDDFLEDIMPSGLAEQTNNEWEIEP